jgi:hypothetical protein
MGGKIMKDYGKFVVEKKGYYIQTTQKEGKR